MLMEKIYRQTIRFSGRVLPKHAAISLSIKPTISWNIDQIGVSVQFICHIDNSNIDVECQLDEYKPEYLVAIYMRALDLCRAQVDLIGFKMGWGLTTVLESFTDPQGATTQIFPRDETLGALCTTFTLDKHFDQLCVKVIESPCLFMALRDLISAISLPHVSLVDCARAIERLRHLVAKPDAKDVQAWEQLREALHIEKAYLKYITDHSTDPRHGRPGHTTGTETTEVTRRSWVIMNRYLEYLKRGEVPLSLAEFPLLSS